MELNMDRILGTDKKLLKTEFEKLLLEYTEDAAEHYFFMYRDKPISFLLENSSMIFAEPKFGLPFYEGLIRNFPLSELKEEKSKLHQYLTENGKQMHPELKKDYELCLEKVTTFMEDASTLYRLEGAITAKDPTSIDTVESLCDAIWESKQTGDMTALESFVEKEPMLSLIYMVSTNDDHLKSLSGSMCNHLLQTESTDGIKATADVLTEAVYVSSIADCKLYKEAVATIKNPETNIVLTAISGENILKTFTESVSAYLELDDEVALPGVSLDTFVEAAVDDMLYEQMTASYVTEKKMDILSAKKGLYEAVLSIVAEDYTTEDIHATLQEIPFFTQIKEAAGVTGPMTVENGMRFMMEQVALLESEMEYVTEYTNDGSPVRPIWRGKKPPREGDKPSKKASSADDGDDEDNEIPDSERFDGTPSSADLPDDSNPNAKKPKKAKAGVASKALDLHSASKKTGSKLRQVGQGIINAGKAVLKIPSDILNGFKGIIKQFDDMDDNRRKEYMLKPGYRKKIFKNLRVAATYGASFYVSKYLVIVTWLTRKLSKEKNKRIRSEFAAELATEIKVVEAKIEDATSAGDQKQRYQLIRLRDKLERERNRVELNAKYL